MPYVTVGHENSAPIELYYEDHGDPSAPPVVLIHGFPLSGASWEKQLPPLLAAGHRVITYDRRGFGKSSQPAVGYDYDTFTADLDALLTALDLQDVALVGFSMGTGEVTHYIGTRGTSRVRKAALLGAIPPFLLQTDDNPEGVPGDVFTGIEDAIKADRPSYLTAFLADFNNVDDLGPARITDEALRGQWQVAYGASGVATLACVQTWLTDFRADIEKFDVPTLLVHGTADRILPLDATAGRLPAIFERIGTPLTHVFVENAPHNLGWTHADELNEALVSFLAD
ncbi:alpha/beta hydrolase [Patulibacter sp. SYSU D01012]|uniref:alpha/beta fold hydrolase n=1 Tax=Patulibacter sp. SYSU D01012 TaxID=2817381 RepID=UPI001B30D4CE|nr:alpha/beta hydrolase [Patulibacter sp. SYSU D01012]